MERFNSTVKNRVGKKEPLPMTILTDSDHGETYPGPYVDIFIGDGPYTVTPLIELNEFTGMLEMYGLKYNVRRSTFTDQPDA